jgi:hypothetical protein
MPVLASRPLITCAPSSDAGTLARLPPNAHTSTASGHDNYIIHLILRAWHRPAKLSNNANFDHTPSTEAVAGFDGASPRGIARISSSIRATTAGTNRKRRIQRLHLMRINPFIYILKNNNNCHDNNLIPSSAPRTARVSR